MDSRVTQSGMNHVFTYFTKMQSLRGVKYDFHNAESVKQFEGGFKIRNFAKLI